MIVLYVPRLSCQVLPAESRNVARKELEQILLKEFRAEMASRLQEEMRLNRAAKEELGNLERQLSKSSKRHYYTGEDWGVGVLK